MSSGADAHEMLRPQAGTIAIGPDAAQMECLASEEAEGQTGAENLPASFTHGAIDFNDASAVVHGHLDCPSRVPVHRPEKGHMFDFSVKQLFVRGLEQFK